MTRYPIAPGGIFHSIQGEGALAGEPMAFLRLAGCSVGCHECDTDYSVHERLEIGEILQRLAEVLRPHTSRVWITGGEPTDHDLAPLVGAIQVKLGLSVCIATAGVRHVPIAGVWWSISPHSAASWKFRGGNEIKLVPGLNGLRLADMAPVFDGLAGETPYCLHRYVQPLWDASTGQANRESLQECLEWVHSRPGWRISFQGHKQGGLP